MAVQLSSSYLRQSYQILATLDPERRMTGEEAFQCATDIVYKWAKSKVHSIFRTLPANKETLDMKCDGKK